MNAEQHAKPASTPKTGRFATLSSLLRSKGSGARPSSRLVPALLCAAVLLACLAPAPAQAKQARLFVGTFGAASNPAPFPANPSPLENVSNLAVDESTHDVYVSDIENHRILKFDSGGNFLLMIGKEVNKTKVEEAGSTEAEQNLCTAESLDVCQSGNEGATPGTFETPTYLAVDNSSGPSRGDLYVANDVLTHNGEKIGTVNEQQTVTVNATGGSFTLSFEGQTTTPIAFDAPPNTFPNQGGGPGSVEAALRALPAFAAVEEAPVHVSGSPGAYTVTFEGQLQGRDMPQLNADSSGLSGGTATATVATTVQGHSNARVEKFDPSGHVVSGWGEGGQLDGSSIISPPAPVSGPFGAGIRGGFYGIAVDSAGNLWVDAANLLFKFRQDSTFITGRPVNALGFAVDSAENLYANFNGSFVEKFDAVGNQIGVVAPSKAEFEGEAITIGGLTVDPATDDLYLDGQKAGQGVIQRYDSSCKPVITHEFPEPGCATVEAFGAGLLSPNPKGIAIDPSNQDIYVAEGSKIAVFAFLDLPEVTTTPPLNPTPSTATLTGTVNPGGVELNEGLQGCRFEWGLTAAPYEHTAPCDKSAAQIGKGNIPVEVKANITGLEAGKTYHYRLVVSNPNDSNESIEEPERGADLAFGPPHIESAAPLDVSAVAATLEAQIDPDNADTHARIEYVTQAQFEASGFSEPTTTPEADLPAAGPGQSAVFALSGLDPHTIYRYRVLIESALGAEEGSALTFTTQPTGALVLPDHRGWEMVSPVNKHGGRLSAAQINRASAAGDAITYGSSAPVVENPEASPGAPGLAQTLSSRTAEGWVSHDISVPIQGPALANPYSVFSDDLSHAALRPGSLTFDPLLSPQASEETPYLRTLFPPGHPDEPCSSSCYRPLVTGAPGYSNVPPGTVFGTPCVGGKATCRDEFGPHAQNASPDGSHVVLTSLNENHAKLEGVGLTSTPGDEGGLYEWSGGTLTLVSILPGTGAPAPFTANPVLGYKGLFFREIQQSNAVSADGSRVVWSEGPTRALNGTGHRHLYLRDIDAEETVQLDLKQPGATGKGEVQPVFQAASTDGSLVFFTDAQQLTVDSGAEAGSPDLYQCRVQTNEEGRLECQLTDLTPVNSGESAGVLGSVIGVSEDGSSLYFVADGVLAHNTVDNGGGPEEAQPGNCLNQDQQLPGANCNLYRSEQGTLTFIGSLSGEDQANWRKSPQERAAGISPNGEWLAFMSQRSLTGYDNIDAVTSLPDQEVFLYDAQRHRTLCASCNPTGARPHGRIVQDTTTNPQATLHLGFGEKQAVAANLPGWGETAKFQPRYLSDTGRLFFNSLDALVPQDSNRAIDVYEYEPSGLGDCAESRPTFSAAASGCVDLISSGTSSRESWFLDASEDGSDVFFFTSSRLSRRDLDTAVDIYDARVDGGEAAPIEPPICEGDGCQLPAVPPNDPTPGSLRFEGAGNELQCPKGKVRKSGKCVAKHHKKKHKHHKKSKKRHAKVNRGGHK